MKAKEFLIVENKKDRKAKKYNLKPRNPMGTVTQTGAGAHRDKKKEQKQGYEKHKGQGVTESSEDIVAVIDGVRSDRTYNDRYHAHNSLGKLVAYGKAKVAELYINGEKVEHFEIGKKYLDFEPKRLDSKMAEGVSYGSMDPNLARKLLSVYNEYSHGVEQYRDEEGADSLYSKLVAVARENEGSQYLKSLLNSASHSAHMDFDTNPGHFKNWFPYVGDHLESLVRLMKEKGKMDDELDTLPDEDDIEDPRAYADRAADLDAIHYGKNEDTSNDRERLAHLEKIFDPDYEYSDDHRVWQKHNAIRQEIQKLKKALSQNEQGVAEGDVMEYETHRYTDDQGNEWEVNDEGDRTLLKRGYGGSSRYGSRYPRRSSYNKPKGYYFYNVPSGKENDARSAGLRQSKSGKWFDTMTNSAAEKVFGKGRYWEPKN